MSSKQFLVEASCSLHDLCNKWKTLVVKFFLNKEKARYLRVQLSTFVGGLFEQVRHSVSVGFRSLRESTTLLQPFKNT